MAELRKIVLAYSGGLDTSIIIPWLKDRYPGAEVIAYCADLGQELDPAGLQRRAEASGASKLHLLDLRHEFVTEYLFPLLRSGAVYEGKYLLGTSIARPLQAKHQVAVALAEDADAVAHGCTGKGNDQVRFEMAYRALAPQLAVIAPWRLWEIRSREQAIDYAADRGIDLAGISRRNIYSRDANLWHTSHDGGDLEDLTSRPKADVFQRSVAPPEAPDRETEVTIAFQAGMPVAVDGERLAPVPLLARLNRIGGANAIGRADLVESRLVGMKSRGVYETPGGTILWAALRELEALTLDADALQAKQELALRYAGMVYNGKWFTPLRAALEAFCERLCRVVSGSVSLALYKGNLTVTGRRSGNGLYRGDLDSGEAGSYDHADASGFINLYGLPEQVRALSQSG